MKKPKSRALPEEIRVRFSRRTLELVRSECIATTRETGGLLIGHLSKTGGALEYDVTHASPPGYDSVLGSTNFTRGSRFAKQRLDHLASKFGVRYLGEWHKHPIRGAPRASRRDLRSMRGIARNPAYDIDIPLLVIANDSGQELAIYASDRRAARLVCIRFLVG